MTSEWDLINEKINQSSIFRFPYNKIIGMSLTKYINKLRLKGHNKDQVFKIINRHPNIIEFKRRYPSFKLKLEDNILIGVCARFGEQNSIDNLKKELIN